MIRALILWLALFFTVPAFAADPVFELPRNMTPMGRYTADFQKKEFLSSVHGQDKVMTYFFKMPPIRDPKTRLPLVVVLHGGAGWAHGGMYMTTGANPKFFRSFIAVPVLGKGRMWAWPEGDKSRKGGPDGLNDAVVLVAQLLKDYPIDPARVYVIGCSDGGTGVFGAARYYPQVFAGGLAISGFWDPLDMTNMKGGMPLAHLYGERDPLIPVAQSRLLDAAMTEAKVPFLSDSFPKLAHQCDAPDFYAQKYLSWLFEQRKAVR